MKRELDTLSNLQNHLHYCFLIQSSNPIPLRHYWHSKFILHSTTNKKFSKLYIFFVYPRSLLCPTTSQQSTNKQILFNLYLSNLYKLYSLSLSLSISLIYIIQERKLQTQSDRESQSQKAKKKKKHHRPQHRFNSQSPTSVISSSLISHQ